MQYKVEVYEFTKQCDMDEFKLKFESQFSSTRLTMNLLLKLNTTLVYSFFYNY